MNLTQFIKQTDAILINSPQEKLAEFIHDMARILPEHQRTDFLRKLHSITGEKPAADTKYLLQKHNIEDIQEKLRLFKEKIISIENGELCLVGSLNEEYDDWYSGPGEEFTFEDPNNIAGIIEEACNLVHEGVECQLYRECYELADELIALEVMVEGDYSEFGNEVLSLSELGSYKISSLNYRQLVMDALGIAYRSNPLPERADALYQMICNSECWDFTLEELMQEGNAELEQLSDFLEVWIEYLGTRNGKDADRLLLEAVALQNNPGQALEAARRFAGQHPGLYEQIMQQNLVGGKDEEQFQVGQEALQTVPPQYTIRSQLALLTAVYAQRLKRQKEAELCWLEAFRSDTKPVNYLRMVVECSDFSQYKEEVKIIYHKCFEKAEKDRDYQGIIGELKENKIDKNTYYTLAFFDGEFRQVVEEGMNVEQSLGWSLTFMKEGMALFLLYLYQGEDLPAGCRSMCQQASQSIAFTAEEYFQGLYQPLQINNIPLFWACFSKWKKMAPLSAVEEQWIIDRLDQLIEKRVSGIMQGNHRRFYGECAAFIAALGEVKESRGEFSAKMKQMTKYQADYSRRTAFHQELRNYGMR